MVAEPQTSTRNLEMSEDQVETIQKQLRELRFLHQTSQVLTATLDLDSVLHSLMSQVRDYFQVEAVSAALLDEETGELVFRVAVGEAAEMVIGLRLARGQGVAGWVVETGQPALVPIARADRRWYAAVDDKTGFHTRALLAVPIKVEGNTIGVIEAINPVADTFDEEAQRVLLSVADLAAIAIRNARLYERARHAERRYESLFNESNDPILVLDLEGKVLDLNRQALGMLGRTREQAIGKKICHLVATAREACQMAIEQACMGRQPSLVVRIPSPTGERTLEAHVVRINYGGREAIQWVGHDISERVALEQMRQDLTNMVIHDLRNPLSSIMSSLQLIHTAYIERDQSLPVEKLLRIALKSGQKLYRLIDSLLDLSRLEAGETVLNKGYFHPGSLVQEAMEQIQPLALSKEQTVEVHVAPHLPIVYVDHDMILRVLTNLLDNAVKFAPRQGHITLNVAQVGNEMLFTVSDDGMGIPPEHRHRIFERFTRLEEGVRGAGLGLAFCKLAVEAHGGRIWVESDVGQGCHFKFVLPLETV